MSGTGGSKRSVVHRTIRTGRVELSLACSEGRDPAFPRLLLLHELGGSSDDWADDADAWPGEVFALDLCGHGRSDWLPGRGYNPEIFCADADAVLAHFAFDGTVRVAGAGVGAYVALLLAGARPGLIDGALLLPGRGLAGGGAHPSQLDPATHDEWLAEVDAPERRRGEPGPDPLVRRCNRDIRPGDYAESFARAAARLLVPDIPDPPPWLATTIEAAKPARGPSEQREALAALGSL